MYKYMHQIHNQDTTLGWNSYVQGVASFTIKTATLMIFKLKTHECPVGQMK